MNVTMENVSPVEGGFSRRPSQMLGFLDHLLTRQRGVCALRTKLLVHRKISQKTQMPIYLKCMTPVSLFTQLSTRSEPRRPDGQSRKEPEAKSSQVCWFCTLVSIIKNNTEQDIKNRMWKGMILVSTNTEKRCFGPDEGEGDYDNTDVSRGQVGNDHRWGGWSCGNTQI